MDFSVLLTKSVKLSPCPQVESCIICGAQEQWELIHFLALKILRKNPLLLKNAVIFIILIYIFQKEINAMRKDSINFYDWKAKLHFLCNFCTETREMFSVKEKKWWQLSKQ